MTPDFIDGQGNYYGPKVLTKSVTIAAGVGQLTFPGLGGFVYAIVLERTTGAATWDVNVDNGSEEILALTAVGAGTIKKPSEVLHDSAGADTAEIRRPLVMGDIVVNISNATNGNVIAATIFTGPRD